MRGWRNWSGSVKSWPTKALQPRTIEEIADAVSRCREQGRRLRVAGSGHSFTPLVATDDTLLSLDGFRGVESVDPKKGRATVRAGTTLRELGRELHRHGLAQENLGDIDAQTLAGAIATGTHGTGMGLGSLSTQVEALTLVTGTGEVVECSAAERPDLFKAARVSLGALGVIARVTLRVVPAFRLRFESKRRRFDEVLANLDQLRKEHRHFDFYAMAYGPYVQAKVQDKTDEPAPRRGVASRANDLVVENGAIWLFSQICRAIPGASPGVSRLMGRLVPAIEGVGHSHEVFATRRLVRFNESEYSVPVDRAGAVLREIKALVRRRKTRVHFPIECRFVKGDDIWLSPAFARDSAYVAVHMYAGMPYEEYFRATEEIFAQHQGRPHWGKLHWLGPRELRARYSHWDDFLRVRKELDPDGVFLNDYLERLFGLGS